MRGLRTPSLQMWDTKFLSMMLKEGNVLGCFCPRMIGSSAMPNASRLWNPVTMPVEWGVMKEERYARRMMMLREMTNGLFSMKE